MKRVSSFPILAGGPSSIELAAGKLAAACQDGLVDVVAEVRKAAQLRAMALASGDSGVLRGLLHQDFRWTTHVGQVFDRDEYIRRNAEGVTVWRSQTLGPCEVTVVGETAVLLTVVTDVVVDADEKNAEFRMPVTQVWVRNRGNWQCLAGHAGPRLA